ncbi:hypothetical protein [Marinococcus luteus]|uniref:hypothetical protein n=1 Tax=Marinococcus luteus TaxID=1122204 RepID=UPI003F87FB62
MGESRQRRNMRIEFNPNHCFEDACEFFVKHIVRLMNDVGFQRLDLALDIERRTLGAFMWLLRHVGSRQSFMD